MKNRKVFVIFTGIVFCLISLIMTFVNYSKNNKLVVYAERDSKAADFASRNMLEKNLVSESEKAKLLLKLEEFDYNVNTDEVEITGYEGLSEELIIPSYIDNKIVTQINLNELPSTVESIVVSKNIEKFNLVNSKNITIKCYNNNLCNELKDNYNVKILNDSDKYNFDNVSNVFEYTVVNNEIIIDNYRGDETDIIIPESINGYTVKKINFDGENIDSIYIPKTVESISQNIISSENNQLLIMSVIVIVISLIVYIIGVFTLKNKNLTDYVYSTPKLILSFVYLFSVNVFVYLISVNKLNYLIYLAIIICITIIYILFIAILNHIHKNNLKFDNKIKAKGNFIKEAILLINNNARLKEIEELLKYSDPVSIKEVEKIEDEILNEIKNDCNVEILKALIEKRNKIIKLHK